MAGTFTIAGHAIEAPPLEPGLYLVATPIGNLRDITIRALETLAACDLLACEDTRITRRLLDRYAIAQKSVAYHEHNAAEAGPRLLAALGEGQAVALVSDAGTPLVSDPGYRLVGEALAAGHRAIPIPGPSAVLAGLAASGLPTDDFRFIGFLPAKDKARRDRLAGLADVRSTLIAFESPHRLAATLRAIADLCGPDRPVCVARELTKRFETVVTGPAGEMAGRFGEGAVKGEIVVMIAPAPEGQTVPDAADIDALLKTLLADMPAARAAREASRTTGLPRADLYNRLLAMKKADG
ncbi:16S rRNA (cytidine(1402)-2'-O)-methyltransferase [Roseitalea porphyridii]|uniref:Ribosomal RNA small subunit methyltransferase I n=1 Tax=Roseitalea porphyridii TaxID=1852022 RepID=A0A4P6UX53_9HYPH|nr:16S rRNA (cytidine(1402)-2'-O)-methyltransferase [Roseitalea porphyridii]QBK29395.1 16S rRNA (cytidine(1402)-2'-O)-methyltransferase [Roseitalea porphyridii]